MGFDKKNFTGTAKTFLTNGICPITKKTKAEFIAEGYTVVSDDDYFSCLEEWENKNLMTICKTLLKKNIIVYILSIQMAQVKNTLLKG